MRRESKIGRSFGSIQYSDTARVLLEVGRTIDTIAVQYTNLNIEQITDVTLRLNGTPIISGVNALYFVRQRDFKGIPNSSGMFFIDFYDRDGDDEFNRTFKCLATYVTDQLELAIKVGASVAGQSGVPSLAYSVISRPARPRVVLPIIRQHNWEAGLSGDAPYYNFVKGARIEQIEFFTPFGTNLTNFSVKRDRVEVYNATHQQIVAELKACGTVPQSGYSHFYPGQTGYAADFCETTGTTFELTPTFANAVNVLAIFSTIEDAENPANDPMDVARKLFLTKAQEDLASLSKK